MNSYEFEYLFLEMMMMKSNWNFLKKELKKNQEIKLENIDTVDIKLIFLLTTFSNKLYLVICALQVDCHYSYYKLCSAISSIIIAVNCSFSS